MFELDFRSSGRIKALVSELKTSGQIVDVLTHIGLHLEDMDQNSGDDPYAEASSLIFQAIIVIIGRCGTRINTEIK